MKIGIVLHPFNEKRPAGLGRFILELTRTLLEIDSENQYIVYLKKQPTVLPSFLRAPNCKVVSYNYDILWMDRTITRAEKADVYIYNTPIVPLFCRPGKSLVIALDFAYQLFSATRLREWLEKRVLTWYNGFSLRKADRVIAISEATKKDVEKIYDIPSSKIDVVYLGYEHVAKMTVKEVSVPKPFFLFVGVIKERKNVLRVVQAFIEFHKKHAEYNLVIVGKGSGGYYQKVLDLIRDGGVENSVRILGYLTDEEMGGVYARAEALIFPSIIEGFGFPVLEAMDYGIPVITSSLSSLPEVAGDAALLIDPRSVVEIAKAMEKIISEPDLRSKLVGRGKERLALFSWDKTALTFLDIMRKII